MTGRASRDRGRRWQTATRKWLEDEAGLIVHERPLYGAGDDFTVILRDGRKLSVEAKDQSRLDLAGWVDQAVRQAPAGSIPLVLAHRRGKSSPGDGYVLLRGSDLLRLLGVDG